MNMRKLEPTCYFFVLGSKAFIRKPNRKVDDCNYFFGKQSINLTNFNIGRGKRYSFGS